MMDRRTLIAGAGALGCVGWAGPAAALQARKSIFDVIERASGGRLGLAAIDTGNGHKLLWHGEERFALASTFKLPLAAAVLWNVQRGDLTLDRQVTFTQRDVLDYAPTVKANLDRGTMTVEELAKAAVTLSDNSAANLLLPLIGGPGGLTRFIREQGDQVTQVDHFEPDVNIVRPGKTNDTTTPAAMATLMQELLLGNALDDAMRKMLIGWMVACETGAERLRAGLPGDWRVGDKTGTGPNGEYNDVAIAFPPGRAPIVIACYLKAPKLSGDDANVVHQRVGSLIGRLFGRG